jgi:hypothetical protein
MRIAEWGTRNAKHRSANRRQIDEPYRKLRKTGSGDCPTRPLRVPRGAHAISATTRHPIERAVATVALSLVAIARNVDDGDCGLR